MPTKSDRKIFSVVGKKAKPVFITGGNLRKHKAIFSASGVGKIKGGSTVHAVVTGLGKRHGVAKACGSQLDLDQNAKCPECGHEFVTRAVFPTCPRCKHRGRKASFQIV